MIWIQIFNKKLIWYFKKKKKEKNSAGAESNRRLFDSEKEVSFRTERESLLQSNAINQLDHQRKSPLMIWSRGKLYELFSFFPETVENTTYYAQSIVGEDRADSFAASTYSAILPSSTSGSTGTEKKCFWYFFLNLRCGQLG